MSKNKQSWVVDIFGILFKCSKYLNFKILFPKLFTTVFKIQIFCFSKIVKMFKNFEIYFQQRTCTNKMHRIFKFSKLLLLNTINIIHVKK